MGSLEVSDLKDRDIKGDTVETSVSKNSEKPRLREGLCSYFTSIKRDTVEESMSTNGKKPGFQGFLFSHLK